MFLQGKDFLHKFSSEEVDTSFPLSRERISVPTA